MTKSTNTAPYKYRPVLFFILTYIFTWLFWIPAIFVPENTAALLMVIGLIASRASFIELFEQGMAWWILAGFAILLIHGVLMIGAAKLFKLDMFTCGVASLANIGGTASAPILAASYSGSLVSVGVLMALMGYVVGTFGGIGVGYLMSIFG